MKINSLLVVLFLMFSTKGLSNRTSHNAIYKFRLTECIGKKLTKPATFYLNTESAKWVLDFNNGDKIVYSIISGNAHDPLCGIDAKDSFGDLCVICIRPSGDKAIISFKYGNNTLTYKGSKI